MVSWIDVVALWLYDFVTLIFWYGQLCCFYISGQNDEEEKAENQKDVHIVMFGQFCTLCNVWNYWNLTTNAYQFCKKKTVGFYLIVTLIENGHQILIVWAM